MIGPVLWVCLVAFLIGGAGLCVASRRVAASERRARWIKFVTYFLIVNAVLIAAWAGWRVFTSAMAVVVLVGARELGKVQRHSTSPRKPKAAAIGCAYLLASAGLLAFARCSSPDEAIYTYLIVAFFDGFSQVCGQCFGRHKLAPKVSPGKTIEGSAGGWICATLAGVILRRWVGLSTSGVLGFCAAIAVAALCGDLAASWVKRRHGVKDFGGLVYGHGGVLDRFDSLFGAAPVALLLFRLAR